MSALTIDEQLLDRFDHLPPDRREIMWRFLYIIVHCSARDSECVEELAHLARDGNTQAALLLRRWGETARQQGEIARQVRDFLEPGCNSPAGVGHA